MTVDEEKTQLRRFVYIPEPLLRYFRFDFQIKTSAAKWSGELTQRTQAPACFHFPEKNSVFSSFHATVFKDTSVLCDLYRHKSKHGLKSHFVWEKGVRNIKFTRGYSVREPKSLLKKRENKIVPSFATPCGTNWHRSISERFTFCFPLNARTCPSDTSRSFLFPFLIF